MSQINNTLKLLLLFLGLLMGYNNCSLNGTNTGNPLKVIGESPGVPQVSDVVCSKLSQCFNFSKSRCVSYVITSADFIPELGLSLLEYTDLNSVYIATNAALLNVDSTKRTECFLAISSLTCVDSLVLSSYNSAAPDDLSNVHLLLRTNRSCGQYYYK